MGVRGEAASLGPSGLVLAALLLLLPLAPPETRGESMAACAGLLGVLACIGWSRGPARAPVLLLLGISASSCVLAVTAYVPAAAVMPLATLLGAGLLGVHVACLREQARPRHLLCGLLAVTGAVAAVHAVHQKLWGLAALAVEVGGRTDLPQRDLILARIQEGRAFASFATPAALGVFLGMCLAATLGLAWKARGRARLLAWGFCAVHAAGLVATASATAAASLLGALLLAGWGRRRELGRLPRWGLVLVLVVLGCVIAARSPRLLLSWDPQSPWRLRAGNIRIAAEMAADHPFTGVGPGGFGERFSAYRRPGDNESRHVHDLPLELAADTGVVAGLLLASVFFLLFVGPVLRTGTRALSEADGLAVALAVFALHNLADFTAFLPSLLWLAAALRGALAVPPPPDDRAKPVPRTLALAMALGLAGVCALSGLAWNREVAARAAMAGGRPREASALAGRGTRLAPWSVEARLLRASATAFEAGASSPEGIEVALREADAAVRLSPVRAAARSLRSLVRARSGDLPGALADAEQAARLYPSSLEYAARRDTLRGVVSRLYPAAAVRPGFESSAR